MKIMEIGVQIICAIIFISLELYIGSKIYKEKIKINLRNIVIIIMYGIYLVLNSFLGIKEKLLKIIVTYTVLMMLYKILYEKSWNKSIIGSFIIYIITLASEIIVAIIIMIIMASGNLKNMPTSGIFIILMNLGIGIIDYKLYKKNEAKIIRIVERAEQVKVERNLVAYSMLLITATMIVNKLNVTNWTINLELIVNIVIFIVFLAILLHIATQNQKYDSIKKKYTELSTYSQLYDEVLEQYRTTSHEFHNKLGIIRGMVREDNQELLDYIDVQIEKTKKHKYSWVNEVKYVQLPGLKSLINMKIMELKKEKLKLNLSISEGIKEFKFDNLTEEEKDELYSIVGVYLDNAREASKESNQKKVAIDLHLKKENLIIVIANTYQGEVNIEKIGEYNYSTKGKERGIGLHLVKKIIEKNHKFSITTEIRGNYFRQIITILK